MSNLQVGDQMVSSVQSAQLLALVHSEANYVDRCCSDALQIREQLQAVVAEATLTPEFGSRSSARRTAALPTREEVLQEHRRLSLACGRAVLQVAEAEKLQAQLIEAVQQAESHAAKAKAAASALHDAPPAGSAGEGAASSSGRELAAMSQEVAAADAAATRAQQQAEEVRGLVGSAAEMVPRLSEQVRTAAAETLLLLQRLDELEELDDQSKAVNQWSQLQQRRWKWYADKLPKRTVGLSRWSGYFLALILVVMLVFEPLEALTSWRFGPDYRVVFRVAEVLTLPAALLWVAGGFARRGEGPGQVPWSGRWRLGLRRFLVVQVFSVVVVTVWWTLAVLGPVDREILWLPGRLAFVWTPLWSAVGSAAVVFMGLAFWHGCARLAPGTPEHPAELARSEVADPKRLQEAVVSFRRAGLKGFVVGEDGRTSTSKVQAALWFVALLFGLLLLLLVGRSPNCVHQDAGLAPQMPVMRAGNCPAGDLALGTVQFSLALGADFPWEYLLLLGLPVGVAVAAKAQVLDMRARLSKAGEGRNEGTDVKAPPIRQAPLA